MRKVYSALLALLLLALPAITQAQVSGYTFAESAGSYVALGGTNSTATGDDGIQNGIPIGFNFTFGGTVYTHFCINTNGWIKLGNASTTIGLSGWTNSLGNTATHRPLIAALWDDNHRNTGAITYSTAGSAGSQVLTVDWNQVNIGGGGATSATSLASFQIKIYETTNVVEIIYGGTLDLAGTLSASVGLNDNTSFLSVTPGAPGTASGATANNGISASTDMVGKKYTFTPPSCLAPSGLAVSGVTTTSANLSWSAAGGATGYEYAVTTSATPPASGTANAGTTASVSGLSAGTVYYLHVRTACAGPAFSNWSSLQFSTACTPVSIPYSQNFDGVTSPALPPCITTQDLNAGGAWANGVTTPRSAPNCMIYSYNSAIGGNDWFYTAPLTLTGGTSYRVTFYYRARSASFPERLEVRYGNGNNAAAMTTTLFTNTSITATSYQLGQADFIPPSSGTYYIGFLCNSLADQFELNVDDITVDLSPTCGGPTGLNVLMNSNNTSGTASWVAPTLGTPTGYEYVVDNVATDPAGAGTANAGTSVALSALTPFITYYLHVRTNCGGGNFSSWVTYQFITLAGDNPCGAIPLTLGGPQECANDSVATSVNDPAFSCSSPNNTIWYTYTPATTGVVNVATEIPATGNPLHGWVAFYTATGTCPSLTLTQVGSSCTGNEFGALGNGDLDTLISPTLTAGVTYYIMVDGFSGDFGNYCIKLIPPPPPPPCTTNLTPANGATGVTIAGGAPITWSPSPGATSYDVFFGTVNPPTVNIGNIAGTTATITGLAYNTTYYWYVVPRGPGGAATGCASSTFSFTTENPTNCVPLYTTGCGLADSLSYFSLKGEPGSVIYNQSGGNCSATPLAYSDFTGSFPVVDMATANTYSGFMRTGDNGDYASIWIDFDDDGYFTDAERMLNNLRIGTTNKLYSIYIPSTAPLGVHRMRVRVIYSSSPPTVPTHPCNTYAYGETEDYRVNIINSPAIRSVATGTPGSCITVAATTIGPASNNNVNAPVYLVDSSNNYIAAIYPDGNQLGTVNTSVYVHNGPVRQDPKGIYLLDRNVTIRVDTQPSTPYRFRMFYRTAELNALVAQPGSGVTSQFDLNLTKTIQDTCSRGIGAGVPNGQLVFATGFGAYNGDRLIDFVGLTSFSTFFLHGGSTPLPAELTFAGEKDGSRNLLRWTTYSEQNMAGFYVERSEDGVNFVPLGLVRSQGLNGNSSTSLNYTYTDNSPGGAKNYYRLRLVNLDGKVSYSNIVLIRSSKVVKLELVYVYPNPASDMLNVVMDSPVRDDVTLLISDMTGRVVTSRVAKVEKGTNTISLNVVNIPAGTYMVKAVCKTNCETAISRFVKK